MSGGQFRGDRMKSTDDKYTQSGSGASARTSPETLATNAGFSRGARLWMSKRSRVVRPGGLLATFIGWKGSTDLDGRGQSRRVGLRGVAVWDKTEGSRVNLGAFRAQAEYIVWASRGSRGTVDAILDTTPVSGAPGRPLPLC